MRLEARGWRVVLLEFPGYGGRPGDLGEKPFVADAEAALRQMESLNSRYGFFDEATTGWYKLQ